MAEFSGQLASTGARVAIVAARFNGFIVERLVEGAIDALVRTGCNRDAIDIARVPGAFEIPMVCERMANSGRYDAVIALGAVIRGATSHYELVAGECTKGVGGG
jgi:6,7-dimethyl-8-ribityllumazine synthase